jgi:hypothetical protein
MAALAFPLASIIGFTGNVVVRKALSPASEIVPQSPAADDADRPEPSRNEPRPAADNVAYALRTA